MMTIINRCTSMGRAAAARGEPLSSNPWPADTVGGKAWAFNWQYQGLPWWTRAAGRVLAMVMR